MAGYRKIPISPPVANNISLLAATDSISIPWDKYRDDMGNIYLDINPTGDPQVIINSDLNPLLQERYLDIKVKPIISKAHFGPVSSPVLRIIQSPSVYVYKLELFNPNDRPEGNKLKSATPFWTEDMGRGPINTIKSAKGGEFIDTYVYYCEYRNGIRTKAHIVCTDTWETSFDWLEVENTSQGEFIITAENRDTTVGGERRQLIRGSYNPLKDSTFDWHDEYLDPYPEVAVYFYIIQEANKEESYDNIDYDLKKHTESYWPVNYLPCTPGNSNENYVSIFLQYTVTFTSGSTETRTGLNHDEVDIRAASSNEEAKKAITLDRVKNLYYWNSTNPSTTKTRSVNLFCKIGSKPGTFFTTYQAPNDGLIKSYYGTEQVVGTQGNNGNDTAAYPKD